MIQKKYQNSKGSICLIHSCVMLYPAYFDARKSVAQGRRVPLSLAVNTDMDKGGNN